jgi:hypothetical protein
MIELRAFFNLLSLCCTETLDLPYGEFLNWGAGQKDCLQRWSQCGYGRWASSVHQQRLDRQTLDALMTRSGGETVNY